MSRPARVPARAAARLAAPMAAAVAVVAIVVAVIAARPGTRAQLPRLAVDQLAAGAITASADRPAPGAPSGAAGWGEWRLEGSLPTGPSTALVHRLPGGAVERPVVERLAAALGLTAAPQHLEGGWYVLDGTRELSVSERAGRHWVYADHGCVAGPVLDPAQGVGCAVAEPGGVASPGAGGSALPTPEPVSEGQAREVARPVLAAVGADPAAARLVSAGSSRDVVVRPQVDGTDVLGLDTRISVAADRTVPDASGWLATPRTGAAYPVLSAEEGFQRLRDQPRPLAEMPCEVRAGETDCPAAPDRVVTGARLGLVLGYASGGGVLLVPAWLYEVRGQDDPVAVVAVEPEYLGENPAAPASRTPAPPVATPAHDDPAPPPVEPAPASTEPVGGAA